MLYSVFFIALGKTQSDYTYDHIIPYALNGGADVAIDDLCDDNVRTEFYESLDNSAMFWEVQSIQAFHSIVPGSLMEFYDSIGVQRDVASRPDTTHYGLRGLTSVKYLFDDDHDTEYFAGEDYADPAMPGWMYYGNTNGFDIWENEHYIPMGFTYDSYVTEKDYENTGESYRELLMLKGIVLTDKQVSKWGDMLSPLDTSELSYTKETYKTDSVNRAKLTCDTFEYTNTGFNATIQLRYPDGSTMTRSSGLVGVGAGEHGALATAVIAILQEIQEHNRYLPCEIFPNLSKKLGMPEARIYSVATFYENFSLNPKGKFVIKVCDGTACHVRGSIPILERVRAELGLTDKKVTTDDLGFTVETVSCLGACGLAPVLTVNDEVHPAMTPDKAAELVAALRKEL